MTYEYYEEKLERLRAHIKKLENQVAAFKDGTRYKQQARLIAKLQKENNAR
jgi:exonuclease VII small subunit